MEEDDTLDNSEVENWYKGPLTERRVATLRKKLAIARGMLVQLHQDIEAEENLRGRLDDIQLILDASKDP